MTMFEKIKACETPYDMADALAKWIQPGAMNTERCCVYSFGHLCPIEHCSCTSCISASLKGEIP